MLSRLPVLGLVAVMSVSLAACGGSDGWPGPDGIAYEDLASQSVGDTFRIYETLPDGYDADADARWPLLVYLDGDWTAGTIRELHLPVVALGVGYPDVNHRDRDYLALATPGAPDGGGAGSFLAFLRDEPVSYTHLTLPTNREV